ncbi:MAG TPA: M48 family metallopeptidase [Rhizomicrobium sp.]|nr:M48 family metallopeptidase [Rhizomicrobium sp.]
MAMARITAVALLLATLAVGAAAQAGDLPQTGPRAAPTRHVQVERLPALDSTPDFDPAGATARYLAQVNGAARARSNTYFVGGYWLQLVDLVYALAVAGLLLWTGTSARIQDWAESRTPRRGYQVMLYAAAYVPIIVAATFPLSLYQGFFREHTYGLSTQNFWQWLGDFGIQFALTFAASVLLLPILYIAIRRARELWWLWAAGLAIAFQIVTIAIWPVFISPLFNRYSPLPESPLKAKIVSLARANDVPVDNVWLVDASRQSNRVSANVSGFLGTARIALNDNLLKQGSPDEVLAVMGHEMGHYAMGHVTLDILLEGLVILLGFFFIHFGFLFACDLFGGQWQVRKVSDVAGLPLMAALGAIFLFAATPLTNSISRAIEYQADIFGLNAVRKPDAFATVMLKLSTYRKLEPGAWEEFVFYDHPSGRTRIATAMRWKKEHIGDLDLRETANLP